MAKKSIPRKIPRNSYMLDVVYHERFCDEVILPTIGSYSRQSTTATLTGLWDTNMKKTANETPVVRYPSGNIPFRGRMLPGSLMASVVGPLLSPAVRNKLRDSLGKGNTIM